MDVPLFTEVNTELIRILNYWSATAVDHENGGFIGRITGDNQSHPLADKGAVLCARILWAFSAAYRLNREERWINMAHRAYEYLLSQFIDQQHGGVYWTVGYNGKPKETHKQIYAQAFAIYGLSEYHRITGNKQALSQAEDIVGLIETFGFDQVENGYKEAYERDWTMRKDQRLSKKEINAVKTANTHLHLVEAYANLYDVAPSESIRTKTENLIRLFMDKFIDPQSGHLRLFFDEHWYSMSRQISYGHDIETSWLLIDAAQKIGNRSLAEKLEPFRRSMVHAALEGMAPDGGMQYERESSQHPINAEKHWWVQAETMVGLYQIWVESKNQFYWQLLVECWSYIKRHILDLRNGEWIWGIGENQLPMLAEDKIGPWKCPYHNTRFCLEILKQSV